MKRFGTVERNKLNADGTSRGKYDLPEVKSGDGYLRLATAFLIGNALLVMKNVFFSGGSKADEETTEQASMPELETLAGVGGSHKFKVVASNDPSGKPVANNDQAPLESSEAQAQVDEQDAKPAPAQHSVPVQSVLPTNVTLFPTSSHNFGTSAVGSSAPPPVFVSNDNNHFQFAGSPGPSGSAVAAQSANDATGDEIEAGEARRSHTNRLPVAAAAPVMLGDLFVNQSIIIAMSDLLQGSYDPDGDEIVVRNLVASSGELTGNPEEGWLFTTDSLDDSVVTFSFDVADAFGGTRHSAELMILSDVGEAATGSVGDETVQTKTIYDTLIDFDDYDPEGQLGGISQVGDAGDYNPVFGSDDDDTIAGTDDADIIYAGAGDDIVDAGEGDDIVFGEAGDDIINTGAGNDVAYGGTGNDKIDGGDGDDVLLGNDGDDALSGGKGNDLLLGGAGRDDLDGGDGDDMLIGGADSDNIDGGAGNDIILATLDDGDDIIDGGDGVDLYDTSATDADAIIDLAAGFARSADIGDDQLTSIEDVATGSGNDDVSGNDEDNVIVTNAGDDILTGAGGNDAMDGGEGDDMFIATAGDGNDVMDGGDGTDTYDASAITTAVDVDLDAGTASSADTGSDQIEKIENVKTGSGDDAVKGNAADNVIETGAGSDTYVASDSDGNDNVDGGSGTDTYDASQTTSDMTIDLDAGTVTSSDGSEDTIQNFENASGGSGDDVIVANDEANVLEGGAGNDVFMFLKPNKSGKGSRDSIMDFEVGDKIDLTSFEGNGEKKGLEKVTFDFSGTSYNGISQAWVSYEEEDGTKKNTLLQFKFKDVEVEDGKVDYEIQIYGVHELNDENVIY